jgi:kynurenine formamidase
MDYDTYLTGLIESKRFGVGDRLGCANLIDRAARQRAAASVRTGACISLARPLVDFVTPATDDHAFVLDVFVTEGPVGFGMDRVELRCHGLVNTHLDALNHISIDGTFYGDRTMGDPELTSMADLATHGLMTRAVIVDIPGTRRQPWVSPDEPVTADDLDRALGGTRFQSGDALLLYMGRDRFEASGAAFGPARPGVGRSGAEWIAEHDVSIVCWDFLDAGADSEPHLCVHRLIRAIGLLLVDNCDLSRAAMMASEQGRNTGALVVSPIAIPGGTGCNVTPLLVS